MITLKQATDAVLRKLDDEDGTVWSRAEVAAYLQDGYDRLCRRTLAIFDMAMLEPLPGNHSGKFEEEFMIGEDFPILARSNFSAEWEREFASASAEGPSNYSAPFEAEFAGSTELRQTVPLPDDLVSIDRVTHNWEKLDPESHRTVVGMGNEVYETERGMPYEYTVGQDGLFSLRRVPQPGVVTEPTIIGKFGLLREVTDDLAAWWTMEEATGSVRRDRVGGNDLESVNGVTQEAGQFVDAAGFVSASSRYLTLAQAGNLAPGDQSFTFVVWVYLDDLSTDRRLLGKTGTAAGDYEYYLSYSVVQNRFAWFLKRESGAASALVASAFGAPSTGVWYRIACGFDAVTRQAFIIVNTVEALASAITSPPKVGTGAFSVGRTNFTGNEFYHSGRIDDVRLYHRRLTVADLAVLYDGAPSPDFIGDTGILRSAADDFPARGPWGFPRRRRSDDDTTRLEYYRLGRPLDQYDFEIPDRFVRYVEWWGLHRAYSKDGPGEDGKLAEHYRARFELGVQRLGKRATETNRARVVMMGGGSRGRMPPPMGRPPSNYGPTRPFRL